MRALGFISHHYILLRQCIAENGKPPQDAEFLQEDHP
jgi:hypothetical protein